MNGVKFEQRQCDTCTYELTQLMSADPNIQVATNGASFASNVDVMEWSPLQMTNGEDYTFGNYALVVLNMPIRIDCSQMVALWNRANVRVTVDGGTNRWYEFCKNISSDVQLTRKDPELVTGDFDSIDKSYLQSCRNNSEVKVVFTPDQSKTDFTKALEEVKKYEISEKLDSIVVILEHSGRIDHLISNIDTLHRPDINVESTVSIYMLTSNSLTWLLKPGHHIIHIPTRLWSSEYWCSLLPMNGRTLVTTSGLKWNLKNQYLEFGEMISTSNSYSDDECDQSKGVSVKTDRNLLWSMCINTQCND